MDVTQEHSAHLSSQKKKRKDNNLALDGFPPKQV